MAPSTCSASRCTAKSTCAQHTQSQYSENQASASIYLLGLDTLLLSPHSNHQSGATIAPLSETMVPVISDSAQQPGTTVNSTNHFILYVKFFSLDFMMNVLPRTPMFSASWITNKKKKTDCFPHSVL